MLQSIIKMIEQGHVMPAIAISSTLVFFVALMATGPVVFYYNFQLRQYLRKTSPEIWEMYKSSSIETRRQCGRLLGKSDDQNIQKYIRSPVNFLKWALGIAGTLSIGIAVAILIHAK